MSRSNSGSSGDSNVAIFGWTNRRSVMITFAESYLGATEELKSYWAVPKETLEQLIIPNLTDSELERLTKIVLDSVVFTGNRGVKHQLVFKGHQSDLTLQRIEDSNDGQ